MPWKKSEPMEERMEFAVRAMQTLNFRALCQQYGISTKTGYKWKERFWRKGLAGMAEESRRPKSHSKQLAEEEVCEIVRLKLAHMAWGPRKIRELYLRRHGEVASESTFKRIFERHGLPEAIRSDNGSPFASRQGPFGLSRLSAWWVVLGIDLERGWPGHPQDNAGHERMHQDISRELEAVGECAQDALDVWRE